MKVGVIAHLRVQMAPRGPRPTIIPCATVQAVVCAGWSFQPVKSLPLNNVSNPSSRGFDGRRSPLSGNEELTTVGLRAVDTETAAPAMSGIFPLAPAGRIDTRLLRSPVVTGWIGGVLTVLMSRDADSSDCASALAAVVEGTGRLGSTGRSGSLPGSAATRARSQSKPDFDAENMLAINAATATESHSHVGSLYAAFVSAGAISNTGSSSRTPISRSPSAGPLLGIGASLAARVTLDVRRNGVSTVEISTLDEPSLPSPCPAREISGFRATIGVAPDLKNGLSACATSFGVWNRRLGCLAIIFAAIVASLDRHRRTLEIQRHRVRRVVSLQ